MERIGKIFIILGFLIFLTPGILLLIDSLTGGSANSYQAGAESGAVDNTWFGGLLLVVYLASPFLGLGVFTAIFVALVFLILGVFLIVTSKAQEKI
jgi:hypothetical protein